MRMNPASERPYRQGEWQVQKVLGRNECEGINEGHHDRVCEAK